MGKGVINMATLYLESERRSWKPGNELPVETRKTSGVPATEARIVIPPLSEAALVYEAPIPTNKA